MIITRPSTNTASVAIVAVDKPYIFAIYQFEDLGIKACQKPAELRQKSPVSNMPSEEVIPV
jgi:hypothetical protein